jgi:hypothetical protein
MSSRTRAILAVLAAASAAAAFSMSSAGANENITYSYDAKGRLVKVEHSGTVNNNVVSNYSFDRADNRVNVNVTGAP